MSTTGQLSASRSKERLEVGLVRLDIACSPWPHSGQPAPVPESLQGVLRDVFHTVAEHRGGKLLSWDADGGAFFFPIENQESYENCCLTAIQMLEMIPALNEDLRSSRTLPCQIEGAVSCDVGIIDYEPQAQMIGGDFVTMLAKDGPEAGAKKSVTITDRVYRKLTHASQSRFLAWQYSAALGAELYRTPPLYEQFSPHVAPGLAQSNQAVVDERRVREQKTDRAERPTGPAATRRVRGISPWPIFGVIIVALLGTNFFVVRNLVSTPASPAAPPWQEQVRSPEWLAWRQFIHEKLSNTPVSEEALVQAVRRIPPAVGTSPAVVLRHDQAAADALLSYPGVYEILHTRLGIDKKFLGTGLSNPADVPEYGSSTVHEYLVLNLPDDSPQVWMRQLNPASLGGKTVKELVQDTAEGGAKTKLPPDIVTMAGAGNRLPEPKNKVAAVIRFAILKTNQYSHRLGWPERVRVFASDLAEVWNLKVNDAAGLSGYTSSEGQVFFVWVVTPLPGQAVLATWSHVLANLPAWLEEAKPAAP